MSSTIWVVTSDGGTAKQITGLNQPGASHGSPSWSPDNKWIAFVTYDLSKSPEVWSVAADGSRTEFIVRNGVDPVYSPDGRSVYFIGNPSNLSYGVWQIAVAADGGGPGGEPVKLLDAGAINIKYCVRRVAKWRLEYLLDFAYHKRARTVNRLPQTE